MQMLPTPVQLEDPVAHTQADNLSDRHDEVREQLELMDSWLERLPHEGDGERRSVMVHIVEFLQRYVLVDAELEEKHLFPLVGPMAEVLTSEHRFIARWVKELAGLAHDEPTTDGIAFRRAAYRLFGLLEAHMHCEETVVAPTAASPVALSRI